MNVATTILEQLGANRFIAMTGARNFVAGERSLQFAIGRNASKANKVRITLDVSDTYTVSFYRLAKLDCETLSERAGVTADALRTVFENYTGLRTSL